MESFASIFHKALFCGTLSLENPKEYGHTTYGFGYDSINDIYKVVAIFFYLCDNGVVESQVKVHTLGANSWRLVQGDFPVPNGSSLKFVRFHVMMIAMTFFLLIW